GERDALRPAGPVREYVAGFNARRGEPDVVAVLPGEQICDADATFGRRYLGQRVGQIADFEADFERVRVFQGGADLEQIQRRHADVTGGIHAITARIGDEAR